MIVRRSTVWAITLRHIRVLQHDINNLLGSLYWPLLDILIWGYLGAWIGQSQAVDSCDYRMLTLLGVLLWQVIGRGGNVIVICLAEELWSRNLVSLFSLPVQLIEWVLGVILFYAIMVGITFCCCVSMIYCLFDVSIFHLISTFFIFFPPLFITGIWLGFVCLQIVILLGRRAIELAFVLIWFLMPFSGAYYPIDVLPAWGKMVSTFLPMSYVFTCMREYLKYQHFSIELLSMGYALSIMYALISVSMFVYCFYASKKKGLARLMD